MFSPAIIMSALELGFIYALVALALYLSFRVLNIADMTTDGAFTLGCAVSATVAVAGHPYLALPLAMLAGQEYRLLYPVAGPDGATVSYAASGSKKMYRALEVQEITLPAGTYYLEYELDDMFLRKCRLERIEIHWDGSSMTFPEDFAWEGSFRAEWQ